MMLGFIIFFIIFGSIFIFLGIALIRSVIIQKREHPYRYCGYPRVKTVFETDNFSSDEGINPATGYPMVGAGIDAGGDAFGCSDPFDSTSSF